MNKLTLTLHNTLKPFFALHGNLELIIAYSGGIDSQVLLHALTQLKQHQLISNDITVCHVNHGLSDNATSWQEFAKTECAKHSVDLVIKCVNVQTKAQQSLEELARDARYYALKTLRDNKSIVLTGHHSDDQSETFLLALKRGAGLKGLSAMSVQTQLGQHLLVRPLLSVSRQEIETYAKTHQLSWVEDESNLDTCYDRNFIRQQIMPLLRERWPSINNTINRSASHCLAGQELLDELAEQDLVICKASSTSLYTQALKVLSPARFNNVIRFFLAHQDYLMPSTEQLKQVRQQLQASEDKTPQIKVGQCVLRRFKEQLFITPNYIDISDWRREIDLSKGSIVIELPDNLGKLSVNIELTQGNAQPLVCLPAQGQQVSVSFSHNNPKCLPDFRMHSRSLKKVLQELNVEPWQRKRTAFLYYDDQLVAAIGHFICKPFMVNDAELGLHISQSHLISDIN
ncbi:tRNA lysidine(34) synthetase TilS [Colwellia sp. 12G3]|uniref:tRNA lysidine(34) synthetase TilS n=1 Tax=Colwellia sp. 12G3 TaxID=2058299 RepID=UPI000C332F60|nr:tRNA lysidine(34) synthetase TilS [Colwellia sp. 12G3]PKI14693.1 tRNA lysidine(34) synthetase TilS [Colwellia sp. 12G3]